MAQIEIFEPGLCCGTGICGVDVDQSLVTVSADLDWLRAQGAPVTRFNLAQEPLAFVDNELVRAFVHTVGQDGLPLTLVDGMTALTGRYPSRAELAKWAGIAAGGQDAASKNAALQPDASPRLLMMAPDADGTSCAVGSGCC
ncbi:arsenite efflux transporter metallochaperone ArsD [Cryobacterium frigoriphilum]|uniref:Arsenite efflux transporter metallochaperone ArsD n=1 Tax=Cryobacterium frigoriphilum TaxID=1259150 RepID=A0A4V3IQM6_9MICO|nr:arsenite efflux transporter metallochaperone ArsD [Cryobacterium frigoriphilum]TFD47726.1 arsenite efflux transporter metallochaperone ArsD [Cryobacterium frigoriphilum]